MKIDLLKNFRSRKETLDNINEIFNLIMDDEIGNGLVLPDDSLEEMQRLDLLLPRFAGKLDGLLNHFLHGVFHRYSHCQNSLLVLREAGCDLIHQKLKLGFDLRTVITRELRGRALDKSKNSGSKKINQCTDKQVK